jgi:23S rRNA (cytosine1962-C5)-methyltransferase
MGDELQNRIIQAINTRLITGLTDLEGACRLFNGFYESNSDLVIDRYADSLIFFDQADPPGGSSSVIPGIKSAILKMMPAIQSVLVKFRRSPDQEARRGQMIFGDHPTEEIREYGVRYAVDLRMNQDASFYLDTRNLRLWLMEHCNNWNVLNCFAYTGSLGAAALAGGASRVCQLDLSPRFLSIARRTYSLNNFEIRDEDFLSGEFFRVTSSLRREGAQFDCVILDAPFFSSTTGSALHTQQDTARLINKVRPMVKDGGWLVAVNNALFLSGNDYVRIIEELAVDGCLELDGIIPIPEDVTGYPQTILRRPPVDPAPFNHPTKIAILRVRKKKK